MSKYLFLCSILLFPRSALLQWFCSLLQTHPPPLQWQWRQSCHLAGSCRPLALKHQSQQSPWQRRCQLSLGLESHSRHRQLQPRWLPAPTSRTCEEDRVKCNEWNFPLAHLPVPSVIMWCTLNMSFPSSSNKGEWIAICPTSEWIWQQFHDLNIWDRNTHFTCS